MQRPWGRSVLGVFKEDSEARVENVRGRVAGEEVREVAGSNQNTQNLSDHSHLHCPHS